MLFTYLADECTHMHIYVCLLIFMHTCRRTCLECTYIHTYIYIVLIYAYMCMYRYIYIHTHVHEENWLTCVFQFERHDYTHTHTHTHAYTLSLSLFLSCMHSHIHIRTLPFQTIYLHEFDRRASIDIFMKSVDHMADESKVSFLRYSWIYPSSILFFLSPSLFLSLFVSVFVLVFVWIFLVTSLSLLAHKHTQSHTHTRRTMPSSAYMIRTSTWKHSRPCVTNGAAMRL